MVGSRQLVLVFAALLGLAACSPGSPTDEPGQRDSPTATLASAKPAVPATPAPVPSVTAPPAPPARSQEEQAALDRRLVLAAKANDAGQVAELIRAGGNVNAKDDIQDSAFLYAGAEGFNDVLQLTLANGADVASTNRYGGTALIPASEHGHIETVRILVAAGVPVNHVNNLGWTAMQEAILLNDGGPRQQDVVRQLLAAGADPNIPDPQGRTALENAQRLGFAEIVSVLKTG